MKLLNQISKLLYGTARTVRDVQSVSRTVETGSPMPLVKRAVRKYAGRKYGGIMNKLLK